MERERERETLRSWRCNCFTAGVQFRAPGPSHIDPTRGLAKVWSPGLRGLLRCCKSDLRKVGRGK
eukprot:7823990-Pyramimonas_sp.AAC.1